MKKIEKKEMFMKGIILVILSVSLLFGYLYQKETKNTAEDALKFKEEYELLNGTIRESDGATYNNVSISKNNPMKYVTPIEAVDIIKNKSGILYIGANWCPWCRNAVEVLIDAANENNLNTVYYLDLSLYNNAWEVNDGKLIKTKDEKEGYYELLKVLDTILGKETYKVKDTSGKTYDTKEKRIYMPSIVAIKTGSIIGYHVGTVSLDKGQTKYDKLTTEQYKEVKDTYTKLIKSIKAEASCSKEDYCD